MESITPDLIAQAEAEAQGLIRRQNRRSQSFRSRFEHTLRVLTWARRIHKVEGGDWDVIHLAVLFHDTGWSEERNHAHVGAELAEKFLSEKGLAAPLVDRIASAARTHNEREQTPPGLPIENLVVMDADYLDEVGVTTLVWDAMTTAQGENAGYARVYERDMEFYKKAIARLNLLKTQAGRELYRERCDFWLKCLRQFRYELGLSEDGEAG